MRCSYKFINDVTPAAVHALSNLDGIRLYHERQEKRHPLGIYNLTLTEVLDKTSALLTLYEEANHGLPYLDPNKSDWDESILNATNSLLYSIMNHLDGYKSIISCFFEDQTSKDANKVMRNIARGIRPYRDNVAKIVNSLKHKQTCLSPFYFHCPGVFVLGYFVEGVQPSGAIGPDPSVHKGGNVAISYNRDLPFHVCGLYYCSSVLANNIYQVFGVVSSDSPKGVNVQLEEVLKRISVLPMTFFPDEVNKPTPFVKYKPASQNKGFIVTMEIPLKNCKAKTIPRGCRAKAKWKGDGSSRTFKLPYLGADIDDKGASDN